MARTAIVTDSGVNMPAGLEEEYGIHVVPLKVIFDGQTYMDGVDITPAQFYEMLRAAPELPTTSQPSSGDFVEVYSKLGGEVDGIVSIHLSELLSGTLKSAIAAQQQVNHVSIEVIDSRSVSVGLGFVVMAAARAAQQGKSLPEVVSVARQVIPKLSLMFVVDTLKYLHMGGRIGGASAMLGTALKIKPLLHLYEGEVNPLERVRSKCRATERMLEIMEQRLAEERGDGVLRAAVVHADRSDEAAELNEEVQTRFEPDELFLAELTPAIGTHVGPGTLGVSWYVE